MNNEANKEDKLIFRIMKDHQMESPPAGFTDRVMQEIHEQSSRTDSENRPLISLWGWIGAAACLGLLILVVFVGGDGQVADDSARLSQLFSNVSVPSIDMDFGRYFSWLHPASTTLFWIFLGIVGLLVPAVLSRMISTVKMQHFHTLQ
jgi:hypothetical protein